MSNFMKGFNSGFQPYVGNIGSIISNIMMQSARTNTRFSNDLALNDQKRYNESMKAKEKAEAERRKILEEKAYHEKNQKVLESLADNYDEKSYLGLPSEYQMKYNRMMEYRGEPDNPTISRDDFVDASKIKGLEHLEGYKVKRTQKYKGDQLLNQSYGQPFKKEDTQRVTKPNGVEDLSKVEKSLMGDVEKKLLQHEITLRKAQTNGFVKLEDDSGNEIPYKPEELKEQWRSEQLGLTESVKNLLGKDKLKPYDKAFNTYRKQGGKIVSPENLTDQQFALYVKDLVQDIDEAYKKEEISAADYKLYGLLLRLDTGLSLQETKGLLNAR